MAIGEKLWQALDERYQLAPLVEFATHKEVPQHRIQRSGRGRPEGGAEQPIEEPLAGDWRSVFHGDLPRASVGDSRGRGRSRSEIVG